MNDTKDLQTREIKRKTVTATLNGWRQMKMTKCKFIEGCVLHTILTHPEECKDKEVQLHCGTYLRYSKFPERYLFAKTGLKHLKVTAT